jgi:alkanesulfonate monooxygenase SsuD/methylene tetrahydromethanopterin reductase-like flavin-dependent oxidoreductase (luciferase family)
MYECGSLIAALGALVPRVRIGTLVYGITYRHPAVLANMAATLDIVSGGRLDLGIGAGYRIPEFDLYGADMATRYTTNDARARQVRELWESGTVTPKPHQERLPIWMGYLGPKGARRAGRLGEYLLAPDARLWEPYRAGLEEGGHDPALGRMGGGVQAWASEDPERDWPIVSEHLAHQLNSYKLHARMGYQDLPPFKPVDVEAIRARRPRGFTSQDYFVFGTPNEVADFTVGFSAGAPVDQVYFWASLPGMSHEQVLRNIRLIGEGLAPLLRTPEEC